MKLQQMLLGGAVLASLGASPIVLASDGEALAKKHNCLACHSVDTKVVGPAYKEVAQKYKGDAGAPARLAEKIKKGGKGVWGSAPMPPNKKVSDDDLKILVQWVLAQ